MKKTKIPGWDMLPPATNQLSLFADPPAQTPEPVTKEPTIIERAVDGKIFRRDEICQQWRWCRWGESCMSSENDEIGLAYCEPNPLKLPLSALSRDELKVIAAGFPLVKYFREQKTIRISEAELSNGWAVLPEFTTYAQAERELKRLKAAGHIESNIDGTIVMTGWNQPGSLITSGFEFYRCYGLRDYDTGCCIKQGSRNWSNWEKYDTNEELQQAWNKLMQDTKALEG